jgi:hypothetical protein
MTNTLLTISDITNEAMLVLENNTVAARYVNRQFDDRFAQTGAKIGDQLNVRLPVRYTVRTGNVASIQNTTETYQTLTLDTQVGVDVEFTTKDLTLSIDEFSDRILKPQIVTVSNKLDSDILALYKGVWNTTGTPGTALTDLSKMLTGMARLDDNGAPRDDMRSFIMDPWSQATALNGLKAVFNPQAKISGQYDAGQFEGVNYGAKLAMDQNIARHTIGSYTGTPLVKGASQTGASIATDGWTAGAVLEVGDIITFGGVYGVNPVSKSSTGQLQQFVVTSKMTADGSGEATISISPSITTSGVGQNVTAGPANDATITVFGASATVTPANMLFHRDAIILGTADLELPGGVDMAARVKSKVSNLSIRMVRAYDIINDRIICRLDMLYGVLLVRPELACRVHGKAGE